MKASPTRALTVIVLAFNLLISPLSGESFGESERTNTHEETARSVIEAYRTSDPAAQVHLWQVEITHPSKNPKFKEFQAQRFKEWEASEFAPYRITDPKIIALVSKVIKPVLRLYQRQNCFKLLIIDHPLPVAMNDSAVLLMLSTGLIRRAISDDEILGHVAHELGHDLYWRRTAQARQALELNRTQGVGGPLGQRQALEELAKIEFECDAFSAVTLASMGRNPLSFAQYLEATERDFPEYLNSELPPTALRTKVMIGVVPRAVTHVAPQVSGAFKRLKALLSDYPERLPPH